MIDIVGNRHALNLQPAMAAVVHPAGVVWLHLQRVDEGLLKPLSRQVFAEARMAKLLNHGQGIRGRAKPGSPLNIGKNLRVEGGITDPADLRPLQCVVEAHTLEIVAPGLAVVGELVVVGPLADRLKFDRLQAQEVAETVVGHQRLGGDPRAAAGEVVGMRVIAAARHAKAGQIDKAAVGHPAI